MIQYDRKLGKEILDKYLSEITLNLYASNLSVQEHSYQCGEKTYELAQKIVTENPEFSTILDPELVGFLGYVHNIGYKVQRDKHELHTIYLLTNKEKIPADIAVKSRHGQLQEMYGEKSEENYYPIGFEGILLTYVDISLRKEEGEFLSIKERVLEIEEHINNSDIDQKSKKKLIENLHKATPRYERYEKILKSLI